MWKDQLKKRGGAAKKIVLPKNSSFMMKALIDVKPQNKKLKIIKTDKRNA